MLEPRYRNAFKEVDEILKYTDIDLVNKIPKKFIDFLRENMNNNYEFNVQEGLHLNKQKLSEEANNILALIYRDYWATEEEKEEFRKKDEEERKLNEEKLEHIFDRKDNEPIEEKKNNQLIKIEHESFIKRLFLKLKRFFWKN
jgi:uncharacterized protein (DUF2267 family)